MTGGDDGAAAMERGLAAIAVLDFDGAIVHLSKAIRELEVAGDRRAAALAAARLADVYHNGLGNRSASRPWYRRAVELVADDEPCVEQGWAAVAPMGCEVDDPAELLANADLALDRARRFGDIGLEIKALADGGLARVQAGDVRDGMSMIDDALAQACGWGADLDVIGRSVCSFYTACWYTADFQRAADWTRALRQRGILDPVPGSQVYANSHCESVRATLLCHVGRWSEAEAVLERAEQQIEALMPGASWHPQIARAELRILQGRLGEAELLLLGRDDAIQALLPMARLHLARGDHELAAAAARRGLRLMADDHVRSATLLDVAARAALAAGDVDAAATASAELDRRVGELEVDVPVLTVGAARVRSLVQAARGDRDAAQESLRGALAHLAGTDLPVHALWVHLDLARLLEPHDRGEARIEAHAARALLDRLDVQLDLADTALLERLLTPLDSAEPGRTRTATLRANGNWWVVASDDTSVRIRGTKGMRYLHDLIAHAGTEQHVLDLVDRAEGVATDGLDRRRIGDAGPLSDAAARDAYRRRVHELREQIDDALAIADDDRAAALEVELDAVVAELAASFGVGGRERHAASAVEKARLNVTRAIRAAIATVTEALPGAGAVLDRRVRTGTYCVYEPEAADGIVWSVPR